MTATLAGALALIALLWAGTVAAACHEAASVSVASAAAHATAPAGVVMTAAATSAAPATAAIIDRIRPDPVAHHTAMPPCCVGLSCTGMHAGLIGAEPASAGGGGRAPAVPVPPALREGIGFRPALPPPRLG